MTERTRRALLSGTAVATVGAGGALLGACAAPQAAPARKQLAPFWRGQRPAKDAADEIVRQVTPLLS